MERERERVNTEQAAGERGRETVSTRAKYKHHFLRRTESPFTDRDPLVEPTLRSEEENIFDIMCRKIMASFLNKENTLFLFFFK